MKLTEENLREKFTEELKFKSGWAIVDFVDDKIEEVTK